MIGIPFNSRNKYQASVHLMEDGVHRLVMKGAPEIVFSRCHFFISSSIILLLIGAIQSCWRGRRWP